MRFEDPVRRPIGAMKCWLARRRNGPNRQEVASMCPAPALGRPMGRALSGRVAASDEQIREPEQQRDALRVLRQSPAPHLLNDVFEGIKFEDGKPVSNQQRKNAA